MKKSSAVLALFVLALHSSIHVAEPILLVEVKPRPRFFKQTFKFTKQKINDFIKELHTRVKRYEQKEKKVFTKAMLTSLEQLKTFFSEACRYYCHIYGIQTENIWELCSIVTE